MIIPTQITNTRRTEKELQFFWLFCIMVAGKNSDQTSVKLDRMFRDLAEDETPFDWMRANTKGVRNWLVANKVGQYNRIEKAFEQSLALNLSTATFEDLVAVHGVGPKTANFFLLHSREGYEGIVLDTHVLRYLRERWAMDAISASTPPMPRYKEVANIAIRLIKKDYPHLSLADADLLIWSEYSGRAAEKVTPSFP